MDEAKKKKEDKLKFTFKVLHGVRLAVEPAAVRRGGLAAVLAHRHGAEEAHLAVVGGGHLLAIGDSIQRHVGVGVRDAAGDDDADAEYRGQPEVLRFLRDEGDLWVWTWNDVRMTRSNGQGKRLGTQTSRTLPHKNLLPLSRTRPTPMRKPIPKTFKL